MSFLKKVAQKLGVKRQSRTEASEQASDGHLVHQEQALVLNPSGSQLAQVNRDTSAISDNQNRGVAQDFRQNEGIKHLEGQHVSIGGGTFNSASRDVVHIHNTVIEPSFWRELWGLRSPGLQGAPQVSLLPPPASQVQENPSTAHAGVAQRPLLSGSASSAESTLEGIKITPPDRLDIHAQLALGSPPMRTHHVIYVTHLYSEGHGYPCANPKPLGNPIKIGDIGLLRSDRFIALQNLDTLPESFLSGNPMPRLTVIPDPEVFKEGQCIAGGVDGCKVERSKDGPRTIEAIAIRCLQKEGAVLVVTSPAELREMQHHDPLRKYLCENASRLLDFLVEHHDLPHRSSIYVVTGTILSAAWATATHGRPMDPSFNTLTLKRILGVEDTAPFYDWEDTGNAHVRTQASERKDQCLFLRGFMITASSAVWNARQELALKASSAPSEASLSQDDQDRSAPTSGSTDGGSKGKGRETRQSGHSHSLRGSLFVPPALSHTTVHSVPPQATCAEGYPSLEINKLLLDSVTAQYAITHEDDWRDFIRAAVSKSAIQLRESPRELTRVQVALDGTRVAFLKEPLSEKLSPHDQDPDVGVLGTKQSGVPPPNLDEPLASFPGPPTTVDELMTPSIPSLSSDALVTELTIAPRNEGVITSNQPSQDIYPSKLSQATEVTSFPRVHVSQNHNPEQKYNVYLPQIPDYICPLAPHHSPSPGNVLQMEELSRLQHSRVGNIFLT